MVLWSSPKSIKDKNISLLAIFEIIIFVGLYWWIAVYFDVYWHIISSIFIAPFLLLKSNQSTSMTLDLLHSGIKKQKIFPIYFNAIIATGAIAIVISISLSVVSRIMIFSTNNIVIDIAIAFMISIFFLGVGFGVLYRISFSALLGAKSIANDIFFVVFLVMAIAIPTYLLSKYFGIIEGF